MCRSIQTLRPPFAVDVTADDVHAAALQYVRKVAGMRAPSAANREVFAAAVAAVAAATQDLLDELVVRPVADREPRPGGGGSRPGRS